MTTKMLIDRKFIGVSRHEIRMAVFLLQCREDEQRQADFPIKEASQSIVEMTASFTNGVILTET